MIRDNKHWGENATYAAATAGDEQVIPIPRLSVKLKSVDV